MLFPCLLIGQSAELVPGIMEGVININLIAFGILLGLTAGFVFLFPIGIDFSILSLFKNYCDQDSKSLGVDQPPLILSSFVTLFGDDAQLMLQHCRPCR
jgi:hypothetical protein